MSWLRKIFGKKKTVFRGRKQRMKDAAETIDEKLDHIRENFDDADSEDIFDEWTDPQIDIGGTRR